MFQRGKDRRRLIDDALKPAEYRFYFSDGKLIRIGKIHMGAIDDRTCSIKGVSLNAQIKRSTVFLVSLKKKSGKPCGIVQATDHNTGGKRIQRTRMPNFVCTGNPFHPRYHSG